MSCRVSGQSTWLNNLFFYQLRDVGQMPVSNLCGKGPDFQLVRTEIGRIPFNVNTVPHNTFFNITATGFKESKIITIKRNILFSLKGKH